MSFFKKIFNTNNKENGLVSKVTDIVNESLASCPASGEKVEQLFNEYKSSWGVGWKSGSISNVIGSFQKCLSNDSKLSEIKKVTIIGFANDKNIENISIESPPDWWGEAGKSVFQIRLHFKTPILEKGQNIISAEHLLGKVNDKTCVYLAHQPLK
jgi:hypothetical protein